MKRRPRQRGHARQNREHQSPGVGVFRLPFPFGDALSAEGLYGHWIFLRTKRSLHLFLIIPKMGAPESGVAVAATVDSEEVVRGKSRCLSAAAVCFVPSRVDAGREENTKK